MPGFYVQSGFKSSSSFLCVELIWRHSFSWFVLTPVAFIVQLQPSVQLLWFICPQQVCNARPALWLYTVLWSDIILWFVPEKILIWDKLHKLLQLVKSKKVSKNTSTVFLVMRYCSVVLHFRVFCCKLVLIDRTYNLLHHDWEEVLITCSSSSSSIRTSWQHIRTNSYCKPMPCSTAQWRAAVRPSSHFIGIWFSFIWTGSQSDFEVIVGFEARSWCIVKSKATEVE